MKINIKNILPAVLSFTLFSGTVNSQDIRFSQALANPLRLNPAMMGANTDLKATAIYRNQWGLIGKGYTTMAFSGMIPLFISDGKGKLDMGVSVMNTKAGAFTKLDAALSIGYSVQFAPYNNLSIALIGGFIQNNINTSGATYDSQYTLGSYNAGNTSNEQTLIQKNSSPDVGFGLLWFMNPPRKDAKLNAYFGASGYHLNEPNQSLVGSTAGKLPAKYSVQAGIKILGANNIDVSPNMRITMQNGNVESAIGSYLDYCVSDNFKLVLGAWYKRKDAVILMLGIEHKSFAIGYSYDATSRPINTYFPGLNTHEISLCYKLSRLSKTKMESFGGGSAVPSVKNNLFNNF